MGERRFGLSIVCAAANPALAAVEHTALDAIIERGHDLNIWAYARIDTVKPAMLDRQAPLTAFISRPDGFSLLVAALAGAAGILSLTSAKSGALIGVLISVTTVPAAGNAAVALALGHTWIAGGAALQLLINLLGIVTAGVLVLLLQRRAAAAR